MRLSVFLSLSIPTLILAGAVTGTAFAGDLPTDFSKVDGNNDGQVSFSEYKTYADSAGLSTTEAAQDFVRAAQGDAVLTEDELTLALSVKEQAYALQSGTPPSAAIPLGPQPLTEVLNVEEEPIYGYETIPQE